MTQDMMTLRALLEKSSDADLLREMIGFTAERLMALEVEGLTGVGHGERSADRITHRNGYRDRSWETRAGRASRRWWSRGDWVRVTSLEAIVLHKPEFRPPAHTVRDGNPPDIFWPRHLYRISPWAGCGSGCPAFLEHRARIPATPM